MDDFETFLAYSPNPSPAGCACINDEGNIIVLKVIQQASSNVTLPMVTL